MRRQSETMNNPKPLLTRWLELERRDVADEAERSLGQLLALLPMAAPSAGFAEAVLARALRARRDWLGSWLSHWAARAMVALVAVQAGLIAAGLGRGAVSVIAELGPAGSATAVVRVMVAGLHQLSDLWRIAGELAAAGELATVVSAPALLPLLAACAVALMAGLALLSHLTSERGRLRFEEA
jgi:hypothetical protein